MTVRFANGTEVRTTSSGSGWAWRQDYTRAWYSIPADHYLVRAAEEFFGRREELKALPKDQDRDMGRCLC